MRPFPFIYIYGNPTTTGTIIPSDSCHPPEHKHDAIRYLVNRMNTYSLGDSNKEIEGNTIKHTFHKNNYDVSNPKNSVKRNRKCKKRKVIQISGQSSPT